MLLILVFLIYFEKKNNQKTEHVHCLKVRFLRVDYGIFVCFGRGFKSNSRNLHSYGDINGLQSLTYSRHLWPLSNESPFGCKTYCDTGHPFIMVISEDPWHSHLLQGVQQWDFHYTYLLLRLRSVAGGIRTPVATYNVAPTHIVAGDNLCR